MTKTISQQLIEKTLKEFRDAEMAAKKPQQDSRVWTDPEGYKYLVQWSNAVLLRFFIRKFTESLPKSEFKRKAQVYPSYTGLSRLAGSKQFRGVYTRTLSSVSGIDDAARSVVRNIEEGYKRAKTREYIEFIGFSQGSLEEVKGDVRELTEDRFLKSVPGSSLAGIGMSLGDFNQSLRKNKGNYRMIIIIL